MGSGNYIEEPQQADMEHCRKKFGKQVALQDVNRQQD